MIVAISVLTVLLMCSLAALGYILYEVHKEKERIRQQKEEGKERVAAELALVMETTINLHKARLAEEEQEWEARRQEVLNRYAQSVQEIQEKELALKESFEATAEEMMDEHIDWRTNILTQEDEIEKRVNTLLEAERTATRLRVEAEDIDIHSLSLSRTAALELKQLREVLTTLTINLMPFYKVIYDIYWKNAVSTLVDQNEVKKVCGIYKIVNNINGHAYIGQSVDIAERWKQHIKRGCGAEVGTIASGSLYEAMKEDGVESFSFFLVEQTEREDLTTRERYWIHFYDTKTHGYNLK